MKHLFIINPRSFKNSSKIDAVKREIDSCFDDENDYHIHVSRYPRDAVGVVNKYAESFGDDLRVYAIGGDGILFDCLNGLACPTVAELATVPYGSTNDFARAIGGGNIEKFKSINSLLSAPSILTDIINCGSNYCLNFCAIGVEAVAVIKWHKLRKRFYNAQNKRLIHGMLTMCGAGAILDKRLVNQYYEIEIDGHEYNGFYAAINFSNGPYYGGNKTIVPEAILNDGFIDVVLVKSTKRIRLMATMWRYINGKYSKCPGYITHIKAKEIIIRSKEPLFVNLDGECFLDTNITLKVMRSAVKIIAAGGSAFEGVYVCEKA